MIKSVLRTDKKIIRELFFLSLPIILSNVSRVIMELVDMVMINRLGQIELLFLLKEGVVIIIVLLKI